MNGTGETKKLNCPGCGTEGLRVFYEIENVPAHSVLLMLTREDAVNYPRGDIALGFCRDCGLISNTLFDPRLHEYSSRYEETQGFSPTFNAFARKLADHLIERYGLRGKTVLEIGCGKGEFLNLLCERGGNSGVGFDPAYVSGREGNEAGDRVVFVKDFYSEQYSYYEADFVICKMSLEHIQGVSEFVGTVRRSLGDISTATVFFQVPDVARILRELAFWDIYYEHCSYFSATSLARLFARCGFDVMDLWTDFDDQYLMIEARPGNGRPVERRENQIEELEREVEYFSVNCARKINEWKRNLKRLKREGRRVVLWGAGSKAVAFLTSLGVETEIEYAVDINPHKHGTYIAGSGQEIVSPEFLSKYKPDFVILMNPVYRDEIGQSLEKMSLDAEVIAV